ncbi:MAG: phytanoyl-CoA dioxygenase family protein [Pseudomonadota bacterium]
MTTETEATGAYPALTDAADFRGFFQREGYIVVRHALPPALCTEAVDGFLKEVHLDTRALFQRRSAPQYEPHVYTGAGHMHYPIMNLPDISSRRYPQFKGAGMALLTDQVLRRALETLFGEPVRLVRSMYFDGHQPSGAHRDNAGGNANAASMIGAWIAAEDIDPGAGRFFVLPGSHLQHVPGEDRLDPRSARSREAVAHFAARGPLPLVAPAMRQGDLLLWNAMAIHGSLPTTAPGSSRRSFTGYYTRRAQLGEAEAGACAMMGGMEILHHSDHRTLAGRAAILLRSEYPRAYTALRRLKQLRPWPAGRSPAP